MLYLLLFYTSKNTTSTTNWSLLRFYLLDSSLFVFNTGFVKIFFKKTEEKFPYCPSL